MKKILKYSAALGGGAFIGITHLALLKVLEEEGFCPGFFSFTSAIAMAAVFYAFGMCKVDMQMARIN